MELMSTTLHQLLLKIKGPLPEPIICTMCVSVSYCNYEYQLIDNY